MRRKRGKRGELVGGGKIGKKGEGKRGKKQEKARAIGDRKNPQKHKKERRSTNRK